MYVSVVRIGTVIIVVGRILILRAQVVDLTESCEEVAGAITGVAVASLVATKSAPIMLASATASALPVPIDKTRRSYHLQAYFTPKTH